jgi:AsmA protein
LPLLSDAAGFQRLEGRLTAEVAVKGSGADSAALARTLGGKAAIVFSDGALRGIDVAKLVNNVQSLIRSGYSEESSGKTEFTELSASLDIKDGIARTGDLRLLGPFVRMSGEGSIDLAQQTISMRLDPRVVGSLNGQSGDFDVSGLGMPIIVEGALSGPRIYPDISGILANPQQALQTLSRLGGSVGELATGVSGAADLIKDKIGADPGSVADGVVSGLVEHLGGGQAGGGAEGGLPDNRDLVGSLLQGVLGRQAPRPDRQIVQPADISPEGGAEVPAAVSDGEILVVLPDENVPIPTPNPLRMAEAAPPREPEAAGVLADEVIDEIVPHVIPEGDEERASDLIKGLIERIGR